MVFQSWTFDQVTVIWPGHRESRGERLLSVAVLVISSKETLSHIITVSRRGGLDQNTGFAVSSSTSFSFLLIVPIARTIAADNLQCTRYSHIKITNIRGERPPSSFSAAGCWITMPARSTSSTPGGWEAGVFAALARTFRWRWPDTLPGQTLQLALETQCRRIWRVTPPAKTAARMPCPCQGAQPGNGDSAKRRLAVTYRPEFLGLDRDEC